MIGPIIHQSANVISIFSAKLKALESKEKEENQHQEKIQRKRGKDAENHNSSDDAKFHD